MQLQHKATQSEEIDKFYQIVLDGISDNMDVLVKNGKYGAISTTDTTTMGYYVVKLLSEAYTLQGETTCNEQISTSSELIV